MRVIRSILLLALLFLVGTAPPELQAGHLTACEWTIKETLRIGSIDGEDALTGVLAVDLGPRGDLYVAQRFATNVAVFSSDGRFDRTVGRAGQGPGEFSTSLLDLGWRGDTLWVADVAAIHLFMADGTVERAAAFSAFFPEEGSRFTPRVPLVDGTFLGEHSVAGDMRAFFNADRVTIRRFTPSGDVAGTVAVTPPEPFVRVGEGFALHPLGRGSVPPVDVTPDGSAVLLLGEIREASQQASFDVLKLSLQGDTVLRRVVAYEPKRISGAERGAIRGAFAEHVGDPRLSASDVAFPEYFPPVRQIVAGHDGSIWLLRELDLAGQVDRWEVYGPDGEYEGAVRIGEAQAGPLPWLPRMTILRATREEIWGTSVDDLEVPYIHRFRVDRSCR